MPKSAQQARMRDIRTLDFHIFIPSLHSSAKLSTSKVLWQVKRQQRRMTRSRVPVSEPDSSRALIYPCLPRTRMSMDTFSFFLPNPVPPNHLLPPHSGIWACTP